MNKKIRCGLKIAIIILLIVILIRQICMYHDLVRWESFYTGDAYEESMLGGWLDHLYRRILKLLSLGGIG